MSKSPQRKLVKYMPPKSRIWGHSTKRLRGLEFDARVRKFLEESASSYRLEHTQLTYSPAEQGQKEYAEFIAAIRAANPKDRQDDGHAWDISDSEFAEVIQFLLKHEKNETAYPYGFLMTRTYEIVGWKPNDDPKTESGAPLLTEYYGHGQCLTTMLFFESLEEYYRVAEIAARVLGIKFNDKHVRPRSLFH